jgi:glycosyltransferase involved in cell wall biosynthesis
MPKKDLAEAAKKDGNEVSFILGEDGPLKLEIENQGIGYHIIPMNTSFNPLTVINSALKLKKYLSKEDIDIVHTHMLREQSVAIGAKLFGAKVKIVRSFHRLDNFDWKMKPIMWLYNLQTDAFIATSEYVKTFMIAFGVKNGVITTIYNGVPAVETKNHEKALGFIGRLAPEKGISKFLRENLDEIKSGMKVVIAGDGPDKEDIITYAGQTKNISYLGQISDRSLFFSKISVLVLPSETEVLPLVILEAFSASVPVVTFDIESLRETVNEDNGILVDVDNYKELARAGQKLLIDESDLARLSRGAQNSYQRKYTVEKMWEATNSLYKKLCQKA